MTSRVWPQVTGVQRRHPVPALGSPWPYAGWGLGGGSWDSRVVRPQRDRNVYDKPSAPTLIIINDSNHDHHNHVTANVQVSTDVGGSVRGSFTSVISLMVHSSYKVASNLNPALYLRKQRLGGKRS